MIDWKRSARVLVAIFVAAALALAPLSPTGVVQSAKADTKQDIKDCLNIVNAAVGAATDVAAALKNPNFTLCIGEASSGNVLTIAAMAAVTAVWIMGGGGDFANPDDCSKKIANTLVGALAKGLNDAIGTGKGLLADILKGIIGEEGVKILQEIAVAYGGENYQNFSEALMKEVKDTLDSLVGELMSALGPFTHYLDCGCVAAGTAAIIKNAGEKVADSGAACLDLLKDPGALFKAFLDDPGMVLGAVADAACDAAKENLVDVCGAAKSVYDALKTACEKTGLCKAGEVVADVGHWLNCHLNPFADCSEPPPPSPPAPCAVGPDFIGNNSQSGQPDCACPPPGSTGVGWQNASLEYDCQDLNGVKTCLEVSGGYCRNCDWYEGVKDGSCTSCPFGYRQGTDGTCSQPVVCGSDERYEPGGHSCYSCPTNTHFVAFKEQWICAPNCSDTNPQLVNDPGNPAQCICQQTAGGPTLIKIGDTCQAQTPCDTSDGSMTYSSYDNSCSRTCADGYAPTGHGEFVCLKCDGDVIGAKCLPSCKESEIRISGQCTRCPKGTMRGDGNTCVAECASGDGMNEGGTDATVESVFQLMTKLGMSTDAPSGGGPNMLPGGSGRAGKALATGFSIINSSKGKASKKDQTVDDLVQQQIKKEQAKAGPPTCRECAAGEKSTNITVSVPSGAGELGYSITKSYCVPCEAGTTSSPGSTECSPVLKAVIGGASSLIEGWLPPPDRKGDGGRSDDNRSGDTTKQKVNLPPIGGRTTTTTNKRDGAAGKDTGGATQSKIRAPSLEGIGSDFSSPGSRGPGASGPGGGGFSSPGGATAPGARGR